MARVAVVGAGVVGVASAYLLCKEGHDVVLIDRNRGPGEGVSRANGAQLSYAYGDALGSPSLMRHMPAILMNRDPAYRIKLQTDPEFLIWGLRFLGNCLPSRFVANTRHLLEMASATRRLLEDVLVEFDLSFDYAVAGKMILYPTIAACEAAEPVRRLKQSMGLQQDALDRARATAIEPALDLYPDAIGRVIYSPDDAVGRPDAFCAALVAKLAGRYGLETLFGQEVRAVLGHKGCVTGLAFASREPIDCDWVVAASGHATGFLPRRDRGLGMVWPVQGYSISAKATPAAMRVSITDVKRKIVFARLGDTVRAAGLADIGSRRFLFALDRFAAFRSAATDAFGPAFEHGAGDDLRGWSDGRPCTPSSRPVIRPGSLAGLYLNLGHGALGWTLCLGSAHHLIDAIRRTS